MKAEKVEGWYKQHRDYFNDWKKEARENYDFVAGHQWSKVEEEELKDKKRLPVVMNRMGPYIDAVIGYQVNNRKEIRYLPRENSDMAAAELLSETVRWADDLCDAEDETSDAFSDLVITGMGWTETRMDYTIDPEGRLITAERIDPLEMFWDINASKRNLTDSNYIGRARKMPVSEAEKRWPNLKNITPTFADETDDHKEPHDATNAWKYEGHENRDSQEKSYLILQCQYYEDEKVYIVADPESSKPVTLSKEKFDVIKDYLDQNQIRYVPSTKRKYYQCWTTGDTVLEEGEAPSQEGFTLKAICAKRDRNKRTWYGTARPLKDPQRFSNKFFSDFIYILATNRKGGAFVEEAALADKRKAEEDWADPSSLIMLNTGGLQRIREREPAQIPTGVDRLLQYAIQAVPEVSGMSPELLGMTDRDQPGIIEESRKQAGLTLLAPLFDSLKRHLRERGRVIMDLIIKHMNDGRMIRISKEGQQMNVPLILPETAKYDIIVDEVSTSPNQRNEVLNVMSNLLPMLLKAGIPIPPDLIDYLPLPVTLTTKWKEMLQPKEQEPDPKIQMEMAKLQMQAQQAKVKSDLEQIKAEKDSQMHVLDLQMEREERALKVREMQLEAAIKEKELEIKNKELNIKAAEVGSSERENLLKQREGELKERETNSRAEMNTVGAEMMTGFASNISSLLEQMAKPKKFKVSRNKDGTLEGEVIPQ